MNNPFENGILDVTKLNLPVVYHTQNGGGKAHPLYTLRTSLPKDGIERPFKPTIHEDGGIDYECEGRPDDIDGFIRDPQNPKRFTPIWSKCFYRLQGVKMKPDGQLLISMACAHPEAKTHNTEVKAATCDSCVMRTMCRVKHPVTLKVRDFEQPTLVDGTLVYEKTGWEPPVCPDGYERDPNNQWAFIPKWEPCEDRDFNNRVRPCGCVKIKAICRNPDSGHTDEQVTPQTCEQCPIAKMRKSNGN